MRRRRLLTLLTPAVRVYDDFVAADGTAITALAPAWTKHAAGSSNTAAPAVAAGRVHGENAASISLYYRAAAPVGPDSVVEADIYLASDNNASNIGVCLRIVAGANTFYTFRYNTSGDVWQLFKFVAGSATQLGSNTGTALATGSSARSRLEARGSVLTCSVNGAVVLTVVDTSIPAAGFAGFRANQAATASTGVHLDNWRVLQ
jgi:hypothetical protein